MATPRPSRSIEDVFFFGSKHDTGGALDLFEVIIPPNSLMPVPHHHRDWEETVYGLDGIITWTVADKRMEIKPGDDLFIPRGVVHGLSTRRSQLRKCFAFLPQGFSVLNSSEKCPRPSAVPRRLIQPRWARS